MSWEDWLKKNGHENLISTSKSNEDISDLSNLHGWEDWLKNYESNKKAKTSTSTNTSKLNADDIFIDEPKTALKPFKKTEPTLPKIKTSTPSEILASRFIQSDNNTNNVSSGKPKLVGGSLNADINMQNNILKTNKPSEIADSRFSKSNLPYVNDSNTDNKGGLIKNLKTITGGLAKGGVSAAQGLFTAQDLATKKLEELIPALKGMKWYDPKKASDSMKNAVKNVENFSGYNEASFKRKYAEDLISSMPQMAELLIPVMGPAIFGITAGGNYADQYAEQNPNATLNQKLAYGTVGGALEVTLEKALGLIPGYKKLFSEAFSKGALDKLTGASLNDLKQFGKAYLSNTVKEGIEEAAIDPLMGLTEKVLGDKDKKLVGENGVFDLNQMGYDALGGLIMGGAFQSPALVKQASNIKEVKNYIDTVYPMALAKAQALPDGAASKELAKELMKKNLNVNLGDVNKLVKSLNNEYKAFSNVNTNTENEPISAQMQGLGEVNIGEDLGNSVMVEIDGQQFPIRKAIFNNAEILPNEDNLSNLPNKDFLPNEANLYSQDYLTNHGNLSNEENLYNKENLPNEESKDNKDIQDSNIKSVPVDMINVAPERFQFKSNTNNEGVTNQFKGGETFKKEMAGVTTLWKDENGKLWMVNGHHRLDFAKRSNVNTLNAQIFDSKDGWTEKDMRTMGAKINIADGKGTSIDSAKIFRENNMNLEDLKKDGLSLSESKVKNGYNLSKLNDRLFNKVISSELSENKGAIIGENLAENKEAQNSIFDVLNEYTKKGKNISDEVFKELIEEAKASSNSKVTQETLFGLETIEKNNMVQRGELITNVKRLLSSQKKLFENLTNAKKKEIIKKAGNKLSEKSNATSKELIETALKIVDGYKNSKGTPIADIFTKYANLYAEKKLSKQQATDKAFNEIKEAIKRGEYFVKDNGRNSKGSPDVHRRRQMAETTRHDEAGTGKSKEDNTISKAQAEINKAKDEVSAAKRKDDSIKNINHKNFETEHFRGTKYDWGLEVVAKRREGGYVNKSNQYYPKVDKHKLNIPAISTTFRNLTGKISDVEVSKWKETVNNFYNLNAEEKADLIKIINIYAAEQKAKGQAYDEMAASKQNNNDEIIQKAINYYGTTNNFNEAGYLTTNGKLLDFSEKNNGGQRGQRSLDHRDIESIVEGERTQAMTNFMDMGNIRMKPESNGFELTQMPTLEQAKVLRQYINKANGEVYVDLAEIGKHNTNPVSIEYPEGTKTEKILSDIKGFYTNKEVRKSIIATFHEIAATIRENTEKYGQPNLAPTFYSQMEKIVSEKLANKITPIELIKNLDSWVQKGLIKADEVKWSGIKEWLQNIDSTDKISKDFIMQALKDSQIKITEVEKNTEKYQEKMKEFRDASLDLRDKIAQEQNKILNELVPPHRGDNVDLEEKEYRILRGLRDITDEIQGYGGFENSIPKFKEKYPNVDLQNLISLAYQKLRLDNEHNDYAKNKYNVATRFDSYKVKGGTNYTELLFTMPDKVDFNSDHWNEEGVIAHTRFTDRVDHEGKKVLFLEEIQSDLHQKGRKKGYRNQEEIERLYKEYEVLKEEYDKGNEKWQKVNDKIHGLYVKQNELFDTLEINTLRSNIRNATSPDSQMEYRDKYFKAKEKVMASEKYKEFDKQIQALKNKLSLIEKENDSIHNKMDIVYEDRRKARQGVSEAPFSKNWHEFVLKRMIRYASENGYDKIAWASGEQNTSHYEEWLRKTIDEIEYTNLGNGNFQVSAYKDSEYVLDSNVYNKQKLEETFGEAIADKIINHKGETYKNGGVLKDLDITIGGEGMNGFYNKIIPDFLNKYLKKWGAKVGETVIGGEVDNKNLTYEEIKYLAKENPSMGHTVQQAIEITPAMRSDVLYNGQPLFERGAAYGDKTDISDKAKALEEINSAYDEMAAASEPIDNNVQNEIDSLEKSLEEGTLSKEQIPKTVQRLHELYNKLNKVGNTKERKHAETYQKSEAMDDRVKLELAKKDTSYIPISNEVTWRKALEYVYDNYDKAVLELQSLEGGLRNADDTARAEAILYKMQKEGRFTEAATWSAFVVEKATGTAQALQALALWGKLSPEGILRTAQVEYNKHITKGDKLRLDNSTKEILDLFKSKESSIIDLIGSEAEKLALKKKIKANKSKLKLDEISNNNKEKEPNFMPYDEAIEKIIKNSTMDKEANTLANKVSSHVTEAEKKMDNPIENMLKTLYDVAKENLPAKEKAKLKNPIEFINEALKNKEQYKELWTKAQEIVKERFKDNEVALNSLDNYFKNYLERPFSIKQMDKAIMMDLKDLGIDLKELVKKHYSETEKATKSLTERLIDKGLSEKDSLYLASFIEKRMEALTSKAKNQILKQKFGAPKTKKQQALWEKVIELSNLGALTDDSIRPLVAQKLKIPSLSSETAKDLVTRANYIQTMEEGEEKYIEIALMLDRIAAEIPPTIWQKINTTQTIFQLLNPKTYIRNYLGNKIFSVVDRYLVYPFAKISDLGIRLVKHTGESTIALPKPLEYRRAYKEGKKKAKQYAKMGISTDMLQDGKFVLPRVTFRKENAKGLSKIFPMHRLETALRISLQATDEAFKQATIRESLVQQMKLKGLNEPTQEMIDRAKKLADERTFNQSSALASLFTGVKRLLNSPVYTFTHGKEGTKYDWGAGDLVLKYPKVPANILDTAISYSPFGVLRALYYARTSIKKEGQLDQFKVSMALGRAATGSIMIGLAVFLARLGILTGKGDDDKDLRNLEESTGFGQYRINVSALERYFLTGDKEAAKVQEGDYTVNYDWLQPNGIALAIGGDIGANKKLFTLDRFGTLVEALASSTETLASQPLLTGLRTLAQTGKLSQGAAELIQGLPSSFAPSLLNQVRQLEDNSSRDSYNGDTFLEASLNRVKGRLPIVSRSLPKSVDALGHDKEIYQDNSNNLWNVFINPAYTKRYKASPEAQIVLDIYNASGSKVHVPRIADRKIKFNGEFIKLTQDEYYEYQKMMGELAEKELSKIAVVKFDADKQAKAIQSKLTDIQIKARDMILKERGINPKSKKKPSEY